MKTFNTRCTNAESCTMSRLSIETLLLLLLLLVILFSWWHCNTLGFLIKRPRLSSIAPVVVHGSSVESVACLLYWYCIILATGPQRVREGGSGVWYTKERGQGSLVSDIWFTLCQSLHNKDCAAEHVTLTNVYASTIRRHCSGRYGEMWHYSSVSG